MKTEKIDQQNKDQRSSGYSLRAIATFAAAAGALSSLVFTFIGKVTNTTLLNNFGVDVGKFNMRNEDLLLLGLEASMDFASQAVSGLIKNGIVLLGLGVFTFIALYFVQHLTKKRQHLPMQSEARARFWQNLAIAYSTTVIVPLTLIAFVLFLLIPMAIGSAYAYSLTSERKAIANRGCENQKGAILCEIITNKEKQIRICGPRIIGSETAVAILDIYTNNTIILDLSDVVDRRTTPKCLK
jgi:hypothetical protein